LITFVTFPSTITACSTYTSYWGTGLVFTITACFTTVESICSSRTCYNVARKNILIAKVVLMKEEFDQIRDNQIRIRKSKKRNIRTNNDLQNTTHKTKDRATRTPIKTGCELISPWVYYMTYVLNMHSFKCFNMHWMFRVTTMAWLIAMEYLCDKCR
jgi:hypothetical protein